MRKLGLVSSLWPALLLFPLTAFALGLGEIEVNSFLNQPLKAEIKVISARPGEIDDLLISLASRDAFSKAGLERPAVLSKLKFKVNKSEDGQNATVSVSTKTPVKEPFLSFLVEADWAKGRLLREFTVLLDPPSFAQQSVATTAEPQTSPAASTGSKPIADEPMAQDNAAPATAAAPEPATAETMQQPVAIAQQPVSSEPLSTPSNESVAAVDQVVVTKGDTLWGIASQFKDDEHSMAQVMLALQMMNPDAFGQDNINNLKVGSVLRVPELNTLDSLSKQEAYAQVLEQNGLWDEYVARKSGAASSASPVAVSAEDSAGQPEQDNQLSLLAPGEGDSENASLQNDAGGEDSGKIRKQLALAEEQLEAAKLENEDLASRVKSLEQQVAKFEELQKMVQIQDDSLAQMQGTEADQAEQQAGQTVEPVEMEKTAEVNSDEMMTGQPAEQAAQDQPAEAVETAPSDVMVEAASDIMSQQMTGEDMAGDQMAAASDETSGITESEQTMPEETPIGSEAETVLPTVEEPASETSDETTVPAPAIITEPPASAFDGGVMDMIPSLDELLNDPVMLGGIGGVLALVLGFLLLRKKKPADDSAITIEEPETPNVDDDPTPIHVPGDQDTVKIESEDTALDETDIQTAILDTEQHQAETLVSERDEEVDDFAKTAITSIDELGETEEVPVQAEDQDDILNEVDVYLAYGLYDNAEDLLKESIENTPDRADYRAKLLDTYFATKNKDAFVKEAEMLKSLGGAADRFWDRVQVMGFELAPENELFSGAKDSSVSVNELEFAKPETPDFDIGADDEVTDFSSTDFNLGDETMNISPTQVLETSSDFEDDFSSTQNMDDLDMEFPDLDEVTDEEDESSSDSLALDEIMLDEEESVEQEISQQSSDEAQDFAADLDLSEMPQENIAQEDGATKELSEDEMFSLDEVEAESASKVDLLMDDEDDISFNLPEEAQADDQEADIIELEPTVEAPPVMNKVPEMEEDDNVEVEIDLDLADDQAALADESETAQQEAADSQPTDDFLTSETLVVAPGEPEQEAEEIDVAAEVDLALDEGLDFDMTDIDESALDEGEFSPSETVALAEINIAEDDITEFRPAEMTGEFDALNPEEGGQDDADEAVVDVDIASGLDKTGTFAPGDFTDEFAAVDADSADENIDEITDIEDLMLPDDVDEVATKLDLAKAFIDMGDAEGARSSLEEVMNEGNAEQKAEATGLLEQIK